MNEININLRQEQLRNLQEYVKDIDKDITLILQSLQWDRKRLQQAKQLVICKYDSNHRIPEDKVKEHEEKCCLKSQNYVPEDLFLPEPLDANAVTIVKLSAENINDIINYAAKTDQSFKRSSELGIPGQVPLTLGRLQAVYSVDERRALHDAVAAAAPSLVSRPPDRDPATDDAVATSARSVSRGDVLLALRDARRRRTRHRRAAPGGYTHELRELISVQMESISGKWNDEESDVKLYLTNNEPDDDRRFEDENHRGHRRNEVKYLKPNRKEHRDCREGKRKEYERTHREDEKRDYERENREDKRREYERLNRDDKKRQYEYDKKCIERNKMNEHVDRRGQRHYDKKYLQIKQEKDDYQAYKKKKEERSYDYKDRRRNRERSSSRDNKKYHGRETRRHKHKSAVQHRDRSERKYNRNDKDIIDCSYLKMKKEPPDYD